MIAAAVYAVVWWGVTTCCCSRITGECDGVYVLVIVIYIQVAYVYEKCLYTG